MARVHPRRAPPGRGACLRRQLGHRIPARCLAAPQPGHRPARGHHQLRGHPPALAEGTGQEIRAVAAGHRAQRQHGRDRSQGGDPVRRLSCRAARAGCRPGRRGPPAAGALPGSPARGDGRPRVPWPVRRRAERLPAGDPPARLGRRTAGQRGDLPRGHPRPRHPASPRPRRPRHGTSRAARQPRPAGQPRIPADHHDPHPLRPADLISRPAALRMPGHRRRRRPLPALLEHQDETRGPCPHRRRTAPPGRRAAATGAAALPLRRASAVPPPDPQPRRPQARLLPHLPLRAQPLAGELRHPRRARPARPPDPAPVAPHAGHRPDQ
jgi:hypothetical protein